MKLALDLALLSLLLFCGGCATTSLNVENHAQQLEPTFEFEPADVRFLHYCLFNTSPEIEWETFVPQKGIVGLTKSDLYLVTGNLNTASNRDVIKIPFSEIDGISILPRELQFRHKKQLYVVVLYRWYDLKVDRKKLWEMHELLASNDIDQFESSKAYSMYGSRTSYSADHGSIDLVGTISDGREHILTRHEVIHVHNDGVHHVHH